MHTFTADLAQDLDAVVAGLSTSYSSGPSRAATARSKCSSGECSAVPAPTCSAKA
ncbi:hypothetical protein ACFQ2B_38430 [Streptomyces stramineus]